MRVNRGFQVSDMWASQNFLEKKLEASGKYKIRIESPIVILVKFCPAWAPGSLT